MYGAKVDCGSALPRLTELLLSDSKCAAEMMRFIAVNVRGVLSSSSFFATPLTTVQAVLECPALAIDEDTVLEHVLVYAAKSRGQKSGLTDNPTLLSNEELAVTDSVLQALIPRLAILSLSSKMFLLSVEPLGILLPRALSQKYKYDALLAEARERGLSERDMVLDCYGGSSGLVTCAIGDPNGDVADAPASELRSNARLRASAVVTESAHPYEAGCDGELELVQVGGWTGQTSVEFDRRSFIGDAHLMFFGDKEGKLSLGEWKMMWLAGGERRGRKFAVFPGHQFWLSFRCAAHVKSCWGWKLCARPIVDSIT
jgi:hypothetical protein